MQMCLVSCSVPLPNPKPNQPFEPRRRTIVVYQTPAEQNDAVRVQVTELYNLFPADFGAAVVRLAVVRFPRPAADEADGGKPPDAGGEAEQVENNNLRRFSWMFYFGVGGIVGHMIYFRLADGVVTIFFSGQD